MIGKAGFAPQTIVAPFPNRVWPECACKFVAEGIENLSLPLGGGHQGRNSLCPISSQGSRGKCHKCLVCIHAHNSTTHRMKKLGRGPYKLRGQCEPNSR